MEISIFNNGIAHGTTHKTDRGEKEMTPPSKKQPLLTEAIINKGKYRFTIIKEGTLLLCQAILIGILASLILGLLILFVAPANANEAIQFKQLEEVGQGSLLQQMETGEYSAMPLLDTRVNMSVSGLINKTQLTQTFKNNTADKIEAIYVFPLPENAVVERFKLIIGEQIIEGQIKEKQQAKSIYQKAKTQGKQAALMVQHRPNIFTTKVANIEANTDVSVQIEYQQNIDYQSSGFELRFPLVVGPRYSPLDLSYQQPTEILEEKITLHDSALSGQQNSKIVQANLLINPITSNEKKVNPVTINITLSSGFALENVNSPSHKLVIENNQSKHKLPENKPSEPLLSSSTYSISLQDEQVPADRDFVLQWQLKKSDYPRAALFSEPDKNESDSFYINMMLMPPQKLYQSDQRLSKETILVLDTSGSMHGLSIEQAKKAVINLLHQMHQGDSFNLIQFNNEYEQLFPTAVAVNPNNIFKAVNYVQNLRADGGTEMAKAIRAALPLTQASLSASKKQLRQVIFITDGSISNEQQLFSIIEKQLGPTRLFTIGIGSAPNSYFMRKAAEFGRGTFTYISNISEVESKMQELFKKLESPLLTQLKITWPDNFKQIEVYPKRLNDLYMGHPLMVTAKVSLQPDQVKQKQTVIFEGQSGLTAWKSQLQWDSSNPHPGVSRLWAKNKISTLMDDYRRSQNLAQNDNGLDKKKALKQEIIALSIKHHIISQFTSFVAVSNLPATSPKVAAKTKNMPQNMPYGWTGNVLSSYPKTATIGPWLEVLGWLFIVLGLGLWSWFRFNGLHQTTLTSTH